MKSFIIKLSRSRSAYRAASYALALILVAGANAGIGLRAAQIFA